MSTTLQRDILAAVKDREARTGRAYRMRELMAGHYELEADYAVRALVADGYARIVWDGEGASYVTTARASVGFGREVHGLPFEVQGSTAYALACETGPREAICADVEATGDASYLVRVWAADASYARVAASRETFREVPTYRREAERCETRVARFTGQIVCTYCAPDCDHYVCTHEDY